MNVTRRVEKLEQQAGGQADDSPSIVLMLEGGDYLVRGERMSKSAFETRWPEAEDVLRLRGFDNVLTVGIDLADDIRGG